MGIVNIKTRYKIIIIAIWLFFVLWVNHLAWGGEKGTIFERKYIKYPQEIYEKYCGHYLTAGGHWDCLDAMDRNGIPEELNCRDLVFVWGRTIAQINLLLILGYKEYPLNHAEDIINPPFAPRIWWYYKCVEKGDPK